MALTWQNVSPSNPAGILQAGNMAAANIAKGLNVVGGSMQEYAKDAKEADTGKLLLMLDNAKDRNERQAILDNTDMAYIDQDIIAKDNQEFEIGEERKAEALFNRTMQTDAAERQKEAAARDILGRKTTADHQQFMRDKSIEAAKNLKTQQDRMYAEKQAALQNTKDWQEYQRELNKIKKEQELQLFTKEQKIQDFELTELEREQENVTAGNILVDRHQDNLTKASASIPALTAYWTELDTSEIKGIKAAKALKEQVATQLYRQINRFDVFGDGVKISDKLRSVTGGTIQENRANHKANVKVFSDSLRNILPGVIDEKQLTSMSERMLNNVQMTEEKTYGDDALNLNKSIDSVRQDKANEFSRMLFDYRESDDGISADEYAELDRYIKNPGTFNVDTASIRGDLRSMLKTEVARQYDNTQLVNPNNAGYIDTLRKGAIGVGGILDKNKIKTNHNKLVVDLTNAEEKRANSFGITRKEVRTKIEEQLSNIPGYKTVLANADISFEEELARKKAKETLTGSSLAGSANSSEQINTAIKYHKDNLLPVPESLTNKLNTAVKNNISNIIENSGLGTRGGVATNEAGKEVFNYNEYNTWSTELRDAIRKKHPDVSDTTLNEEIGKIVAKDSFLTKSLDMHNRTVDLLKELAQTTDAMKVARSKDELTKAKDFEDNPRLYLYEHIASSGAIGDILGNLKSKGNESENIDNYNQTARNIQEVANRIYDVLREKHKGITTNELRKKAENAFNSLKIDTQWFYGNEASFNKMSKEEIIRAGENLERDASDTGTTKNEAIRLLEARINAARLPTVKNQLQRQLDSLKRQG